MLLNDAAAAKRPVGGSPGRLIGSSIAGVTALVFVIMWFLLAADRLLPPLFLDRLNYSRAVLYATAFT